MKVAKWGNSLAIRLPKSLIEQLNLSEGDEVEIGRLPDVAIAIRRNDRKARAIEALKSIQGCLPADIRVDRDEANAR